jgi:hypothetical protein
MKRDWRRGVTARPPCRRDAALEAGAVAALLSHLHKKAALGPRRTAAQALHCLCCGAHSPFDADLSGRARPPFELLAPVSLLTTYYGKWLLSKHFLL